MHSMSLPAGVKRMKVYETLHLIKGEDLNHHGTLFAARAAAWLVEAGFAAAACEHGDAAEVVLRNLQNMSFSQPVKSGTVIKFASRVVYAGRTSLMVAVTARNAMTEEPAIEGYITFVTIDKDSGNKKLHKVELDEITDEEELQLREKALRLKAQNA